MRTPRSRLIRISAETYLCRAKAWRCKRDREKCIADYTKVIELNPKWVCVCRSRAGGWPMEDALDGAMESIDAAIETQSRVGLCLSQ